MVGRVIGLVALCFLVGLFLSLFGVTAQSIFTDTVGTLLSLLHTAEHFLLWAIPYIALGAVIVVPLAILGAVRRFAGRR